MTGLIRNIGQKVIKLLDYFPAVAIIGARQAGKTTIAQNLLPDWQYIDLENSHDYDRVSYDPNFFFKQYPNHVIFDEAQEYPELFRILRGVIDSDRKQKGRFILTGSSSPELINHISETLAGRIATIELGTLKANEIYRQPLSKFYQLFLQTLAKDKIVAGKPPISNEQMQTVWLKGGYPEPVLSKDDYFYAEWMDNYHQNYLNRDIGKLFPKLNKIAYRRFLTMLCQLSSTIINKSELSRAIEVSEKTAREYLTIAEGTFLWRSLPSYEKSITKSVIKMPKGYIRDSGLMHYLLGIHELEQLYSHPIVGHSFEAFVIEELLQGLKATQATSWDAYYYRTKNQAEIDLIIEGPFGVLPVEIKYGSTVKRNNLRALQRFVIDNKLAFGILINQSEKVEWLTDEIAQLPVGWL